MLVWIRQASNKLKPAYNSIKLQLHSRSNPEWSKFDEFGIGSSAHKTKDQIDASNTPMDNENIDTIALKYVNTISITFRIIKRFKVLLILT